MAKARAYTIGTIPEDQKFRGQARLILDNMSETEPRTTAFLAEAIKPKLQTRQDPTRVVAFYMSVWKKKGWAILHEIEVTASEAAESAAAESAPQNVQDEVGGVHADEHVAAQTEAAVSALIPGLNVGLKLSEAVVEIIKHRGALDPESLVGVLSENGFDVKVNQVQSAINNLVRKNAVTVGDGGFVSIAA